MSDDLKRIVVWKNLLLNGTDHCALLHTTEGWLLKGTVVGVLEDHRPVLATYEVTATRSGALIGFRSSTQSGRM